jgi:hypothetical protein
MALSFLGSYTYVKSLKLEFCKRLAYKDLKVYFQIYEEGGLPSV